MDFSNLKRFELYGLGAAALLVVCLFLPWFDLGLTAEIRNNQDAWVCGEGDFSCTGWESFPMMRWLLVAAAVAPVLLAYFVLRAEKGKYPTGEFTMTVGLAVIVLVGFNGVLNKPGNAIQEAGISLDYGYFLAIVAGFIMAGAGALRSLESGGGAPRKPPGTY